MEIGVSKHCVGFRDFSFELRALFDKWVHSKLEWRDWIHFRTRVCDGWEGVMWLDFDNFDVLKFYVMWVLFLGG